MILKTLNKTFLDGFRGLSEPIWWLATLNFVNRFGSVVMAFLTIYLTDSLGFSLQTAGILFSIYGIGTIGGAYFGGFLTDRMGFWRVQVITLLASGVTFLVALTVRDFYMLAAILLLNGMASDAFRPANSVALRYYSTEQTLMRSLSLVRVAVNLAMGGGMVIGGFLALLGWHWLFIFDAVTCFAAVFILFFYLKNPIQSPPQYPTKKTIEKVDNQQNTSAYKDNLYLIFIISTFLGATAFMQLIYTVPKFFKAEYGWNEAIVGAVSSINAFLVTFLDMPIVAAAQDKKTKLWWIRLGIFCYAISYAFLCLPNGFAWFAAISYMLFISLGEIFVMPFSSTWALRHAGAARQGQYLALYTIAYSATNVLAPIFATQIIVRLGYNWLWGLMMCCAVASFWGFQWLAMRLNRRLP